LEFRRVLFRSTRVTSTTVKTNKVQHSQPHTNSLVLSVAQFAKTIQQAKAQLATLRPTYHEHYRGVVMQAGAKTIVLPEWVKADIPVQVTHALKEDIGSGDITAELIPEDATATAKLITREAMVLSGRAWVDEVFSQLGGSVTLTWHYADGERIPADGVVLELEGRARTILTAERTALNFLQTLSGTATTARHSGDLVAGTGCTLLDTRKTIPGLSSAQKYAVTCGGCANHRIGLYDAFLIKENHIAAHGSITEAVKQAQRLYPKRWVEVETEN